METMNPSSVQMLIFPKEVKLYNLFSIDPIGPIRKDKFRSKSIKAAITDKSHRTEMLRVHDIICEPVLEIVYRCYGQQGLDNELLNLRIDWKIIDTYTVKYKIQLKTGLEREQLFIVPMEHLFKNSDHPQKEESIIQNLLRTNTGFSQRATTSDNTQSVTTQQQTEIEELNSDESKSPIERILKRRKRAKRIKTESDETNSKESPLNRSTSTDDTNSTSTQSAHSDHKHRARESQWPEADYTQSMKAEKMLAIRHNKKDNKTKALVRWTTQECSWIDITKLAERHDEVILNWLNDAYTTKHDKSILKNNQRYIYDELNGRDSEN